MASVTICRSHAYDQYVKDLAAKLPGCNKPNENVSGHTHTTALRCTVANTVIDTRETATFQGDTAVHSETHATYTPPLYGVSESTMIMDQKYLGSCPADIATGGHEKRRRENRQYLETLTQFHDSYFLHREH